MSILSRFFFIEDLQGCSGEGDLKVNLLVREKKSRYLCTYIALFKDV